MRYKDRPDFYACRNCQKRFMARGHAIYCSPECQLLDSVEQDLCGCWLWQKYTSPDGYGYVNVGSLDGSPKKVWPAHRVSYWLFVSPFPKSALVCHKCDTPACINPGHLFLGTPKSNMADRKAKGRIVDGSYGRTGPVLTAELALAIRRDTRRNVDICLAFGVSGRTVRDIRYGRTWKHI